MIPQGLPSGSPFLSPLIRQRIVYRCAGLYLTVTVKVAINVSGRAYIRVTEPHEQIVDYLKWFDENWKDKVKNIYGIICLNNPTKALLDKVHNNNRVRVFEYQISYTER